jgi:hypothetical protein
MPAGAKGLSPGPSARRFFWSIGEEEDDGEGRRTIVWLILDFGVDLGADQRKVKKAELGIISFGSWFGLISGEDRARGGRSKP